MRGKGAAPKGVAPFSVLDFEASTFGTGAGNEDFCFEIEILVSNHRSGG
jgi:hypothetical protein